MRRPLPKPVATAESTSALKRHEPKQRRRGAQSKAVVKSDRPVRRDPTEGMTDDEKDEYFRRKEGL